MAPADRYPRREPLPPKTARAGRGASVGNGDRQAGAQALSRQPPERSRPCNVRPDRVGSRRQRKWGGTAQTARPVAPKRLASARRARYPRDLSAGPLGAQSEREPDMPHTFTVPASYAEHFRAALIHEIDADHRLFGEDPDTAARAIASGERPAQLLVADMETWTRQLATDVGMLAQFPDEIDGSVELPADDAIAHILETMASKVILPALSDGLGYTPYDGELAQGLGDLVAALSWAIENAVALHAAAAEHREDLAERTVTLTPDERNLVRREAHQQLAQDWPFDESTDRAVALEALRSSRALLDLAADVVTLLDALGWDEDADRDEYTLSLPGDQMARLGARLRQVASGCLHDELHGRHPDGESDQTAADRELLRVACRMEGVDPDPFLSRFATAKVDA